jgi:hypothetical protein
MEHRQDIEPKEGKIVQFRDDLRTPQITWGRCLLTGEFGPVVGLDPGDIAIDCPNTDKGVEYDPVTKEVRFTVWEPQIIEQQMTLSREGLVKLLAWMDDQTMPVPTITPVLVYKWQVLYTDGSVLSQYQYDPGSGQEVENNSNLIDHSRIGQLSVIPRDGGPEPLPTYTFVPETGKFFKNGQEIDVHYTEYVHAHKPKAFYARKVTHTWGSIVGESLSRTIQNAHTTVLQLLGWHTFEGGPCCIIAIDERGNFRPWKYV